ncbi:unnamed protein product, partial [Choristocarpus tenellus]
IDRTPSSPCLQVHHYKPEIDHVYLQEACRRFHCLNSAPRSNPSCVKEVAVSELLLISIRGNIHPRAMPTALLRTVLFCVRHRSRLMHASIELALLFPKLVYLYTHPARNMFFWGAH